MKLLDNAQNQPTKFRTKNWAEKNDDASGLYSKYSQIKFRSSMLRSSLCDYSDAYKLVKGLYQQQHKQKIIQIMEIEKKYCAPFTDCIIKINNTQIEMLKTLMQ